MNKSNFNQTGLYPLNTERLQELQTSFSIFNQLGWAIGNYAIIEGCVLSGGVVSAGYVFIDGEVYPFIGGNIQTQVRVFKTPVIRAFQDGSEKTVYDTYEVRFATGAGSIAWENFKRPNTLLSLSDITSTLLERVLTAENKLSGIEAGAEVNVQSDFNQLDTTAADYIKNVPNLQPFLYKAVYDVPDVNSGDEFTVNFPSVGTSNYLVVGSLVSHGSNWRNDNDVFWTIRTKTTTSFKLLTKEVSGVTQVLKFEYALIPY